MDWVQWFLFESPAALGAVLGIVLFVLLVRWRRRGDARPLVIALALAAALLLTQGLVVTRREHADRILRRIERDIVAGRVNALEGALARDFDAGGFQDRRLDRDTFLALVQQFLGATRVRWLRRVDSQLRDTPAEGFTVSVAYFAETISAGTGFAARTGWRLAFRHTDAGWQIVEIQCEYLDTIVRPSWDDLARAIR